MPSQRPTFAERLSDRVRPIVAVGSIEHELARHTDDRPELAAVQSPLLLEDVIARFVEAGAELVLTPTERASRLWLEPLDRAEKVYELNRKAVWIARKAARKAAYVGGVVAPPPAMLEPIGPLTKDMLRRSVAEQAIALLDGGCDVLVLKSFVDLDELLIALETVAPIANGTPIVALKSFPEDGAVLATSFPADVARLLAAQAAVAAVGACGTVGPQRMRSIVAAMRSGTALPLAALPDCGIPTIVGGKAIYTADADYVARSVRHLADLGTRIVGTDRGTTVPIVAAISEALRSESLSVEETPPAAPATHLVAPMDRQPPSSFAEALRTRFVVTAELDIPRGLDMRSVLDGAAFFRKHGFDAVNISDGARARLRVNSIMLSALVQQQTGIECIAHIACRDRNMVALQSDLLGAALLGVQNILAVSGDPTHIGDFPRAKSVGDLDSIGLIRAARMMNAGRDLAGNPLGSATSFTIACACNPCAEDLDEELDRLARKIAEGAEAVFTQPIFDPDTWLRFIERVRALPARFIVGVLPLRSLRHAEFLHYEVPGMVVPGWVRQRLAHAATPRHAAEEGIAIAAEFLAAVRPHADGVYLMPPFKKYSVAVEVLRRAGVAVTADR
ncbi:MAG: bifunctional homocysteine S-methyltransferase/methylenetetrahydrofolate reductase [Chlorobi bacterium]|nr:bifunctional homocysteine S-methyltransferase/methylenetetrahydrofolate reductase [Chlorobiota bacterium]